MYGIRLIDHPVLYCDGMLQPDTDSRGDTGGSIAARILAAHNQNSAADQLSLRFDALASHDITFVGIIQSARASGMDRFPLPYILTCCHNSLCAVGGTINADDHAFGLSAAKKYGGVFVPPHAAVIHQYLRETAAGGGRMLLGSDSHTRYGPLGTMGIGEGGPELVKQLLRQTYDIPQPDIVAVYLTGTPAPGVGPQDVALALIGATYANNFVQNKVLEFFGPALPGLSMDFRLGIDVMTTETACLSSIWATDSETERYLSVHGRPEDYTALAPAENTRYDAAITIDLSAIPPMIALPFHPSHVYSIAGFLSDAADILRGVEREAAENGLPQLRLTDKVRGKQVYADQGIIAGCAGGLYENLCDAAAILSGAAENNALNSAFSLSVYPASQPLYLALIRSGALASLTACGASVKTAFCGPCFGAGDVPANNAFSIRHTTRNFMNREGARPGDGQAAGVALMDARSIAATAAAGGVLTPATDMAALISAAPVYAFDASVYRQRVYNGVMQPQPDTALVFGPNITDWPAQPALPEHLLLRFCSVILDPVTTTDELIPSGESSSYRSNPLRLAELTLSRRDPGYVARAKAVAAEDPADILRTYGLPEAEVLLKSAVFALRPGDGSAREQAASCQRVLGGGANLAAAYATKRYRSNVINWGMLPLRLSDPADAARIAVGGLLWLPNIRTAIAAGESSPSAYLLQDGAAVPLCVTLDALTEAERAVLLAGSLINYNALRLRG